MTGHVMKSMRYRGGIIAALCCVGFAVPSFASAQVRVGIGISVGTPPPPFPVYEQPYVPGPDYIWTPGYWAWGEDGYFWVPGAWVLAPAPGLLWTPGYWAWDGAEYSWSPGYWSRRVGYYGGINYGFGYFGRGYVGGGWYRGHFRYNRAVTRVNTTVVRNVYMDRTVIVNNHTTNRTSYSGGRGGVVARPGAAGRAPRGRGRPMTSTQMQHERIAGQDRNQLARVNQGHPKQLSVSHPFTPQNRPSTFERIRPGDHGAPRPNAARPNAPHPNTPRPPRAREAQRPQRPNGPPAPR